jgi:hypothetical protein
LKKYLKKFRQKSLVLQAKKIRNAQLVEIKEKKHLNKLICSKISQLLHKELTEVKFSEKIHQIKGNDHLEKSKSSKNSRKKNKNSKIRFKANSTSHLKEDLLDYLVVDAKKVKKGKQDVLEMITKVNQNWQNQQLRDIKNCVNQIDNQVKTLTVRFTEKRYNQTFYRLKAIAKSGMYGV